MRTRTLLVTLALTATLAAENWPRFRGPNGAGVSAAPIPVQWKPDQIKWKTPLPGVGHGSPIVWEDRVYLLCANENTGQRTAVGLNTKTGKIVWKKSFTADKHRHHKQNSFASTTPAADHSGVYFTWGTPEALTLIAFKHDGTVIWRANLGPVKGGHGFGASPIILGDLVVLNNDQDGDSSLIAVDKASGALKWKTPRQSQRLTYSTPCLYQAPGRDPELIFTNWHHGITGIDPATGKVNWENDVFGKPAKERAIGSPIIAGDLVIGTCGFVTNLKHVVALRPKGGLMEEAWRIEKSVPHIPTLLLLGKNLFLWNDQGVVTCADAATGKVKWTERAIRSGRFLGSPVAANGKIYCAEASGKIVVLRGDGEFGLLAENDLDDTCHTTPAISNGIMYIRTYTQLFAIGN
tara:strand:- start:188 stop:1408 length:1221 start_codon:yes stop_codon:yes gene_type:complete